MLVERLLEASDGDLAVIVAPPGYGKTSLLCEWAERDQRPFLWLAAEECGTDQDPSPVIGRVRGRRRSSVLVLDDAHLLAPAVLREIIDTALTDLPAGSAVAIASRTEPELPIGRLRAYRGLVEVRTQDLAMSAAEAETLLRRAGVELEPGAAESLVGQTEGWPAALYLAALSLRGDHDLPAGPNGFGGGDHFLSEFLRDEVLAAMPVDLTRFVLRTSILDELSGALCDDLLEERGSGLALSTLARLNKLLVPLDSAHERYRWQRLFRDALKAELRRAEPDVESRLHQRASAWYVRQGEIEHAIDHAVAAGDAERTGELLWPNILAYLAQGRTATVERWLSSFADDRIADCAPLALCKGHTALAAGNIALAQNLALASASALERGSPVEQTPSLATGLAAIETLLARTGAIQMREAASRALQGAPDDSPWRSVLCLLAGVAEHLIGEREAASSRLEQGVYLSGAAAPGVATVCLGISAMIAIERGDWDEAVEMTDRAHAVIEERGLATYPLCAIVFAASAAVRAHEGRSDEAKWDRRTAIDLLTELGDFIPWYGAHSRILLAHASLWLADIVGARTLLAEASRLARRTPDAVIFQQWFDEAWAYMDTLAESSLAGPSSLTIAELRILRFLPSHRSFREIATQLGVSANTVKTQAHAVYRKLGAASRSEAVARASEAGILGH
jgi:LuxR family transcriptional regulator, maltose regulon positive regulatory protein